MKLWTPANKNMVAIDACSGKLPIKTDATAHAPTNAIRK
jgi:hypothetical protein